KTELMHKERILTRRVDVSILDRGLIVAVCLCAAVTVFLLLKPNPRMGTTMVWLILLGLLGWLTFHLDLRRQTPIGSLFFHKHEWVWLPVIVVAATVISGHDITHWRWVGTPDETRFFMTAQAWLEGRLDRFILSEDGVFGYHPVLSTAYQALFMKMFGSDLFGWRLSSVFAFSLSIPFVYLLVRELWNTRSAYIAAILFGSAKLAIGFAHYGYNNIQVYLPVWISLGLMAWSIRRQSLFGYYLSGLIAGLGFYTYYPARLAPVLTILLGSVLGAFPVLRKGKCLSLIFVLGIVVALLPLLMQFDTLLANMLQQTMVTGGEKIEGAQVLDTLKRFFISGGTLHRIGKHWFMSFIYGIQYKYPHHFQTNPVIDPFSGFLAYTGVWLALLNSFKRRRDMFLVLAFAVSSFIVGAISSHDRPPLTRLLFLTPFMAIFAGLAIDALVQASMRVKKFSKYMSWIVLIGFTSVSAAWNVYTLNKTIYVDSHGYGDGTTGELIRLIQSFPDNTQVVYIQRSDTYMDSVDLVFDYYTFRHRAKYIRPFTHSVEKDINMLKPPCLVVYELKNARQITELRAYVANRFPGAAWQNSDPGKRWSLPYCFIPGTAKEHENDRVK
ncbi:glycosyltransferase family 39 protein, partial [bacterium]|nr:glycosyltransferase family 39 protein [candidate division CSSED10-310 bacterium]